MTKKPYYQVCLWLPSFRQDVDHRYLWHMDKSTVVSKSSYWLQLFV